MKLVDARKYLSKVQSTLYSMPMGLRTGIDKLDNILRGLEPADIVVVGARTAMGKSALMVDMALNVLTQEPVGIFSIEMSRKLLQERMIANLANVSFSRMKRDNLLSIEKTRITNAFEELQQRNAHYIDDTSLITPQLMQPRIEDMVNIGVKSIFIDHLHLMRLHYMPHNKSSTVGDIMVYLQGFAKSFNIPIVILSQLNRGPEDREDDHRPRLNDLYYSDEIAQIADKILLLYRPGYYDHDRDVDENAGGIETAYIYVKKNRNGTTGRVKCTWSGDSMSFGNFVEDVF